MGKLIRAIAGDGSVVAYVLDSTDVVSRAEQIHATSAVVTAALGRLLTAASMMGAMLKGENSSLTLRVAGDGPAGSIIAVSDSSGNVRGYAGNAVVEIPLNEYGKLDVAGAVGRNGSVYVIKDLGLREPYVGQVPILSGEIAEDITGYFATSEQVPTVCALGVLVNPDLTVRAAGGFIAQLLPGADEDAITKLETNLKGLDSVTQMLDKGMTPEDICNRVLDGMAPEILDESDVLYRCGCTKARYEKALAAIGREELCDIIEQDRQAEIVCHFCNQKYLFDEQELRVILASS
ncbi:MAG: Hsp33 family molecular chaperone HslO [Acetanaerobacterium sp.]